MRHQTLSNFEVRHQTLALFMLVENCFGHFVKGSETSDAYSRENEVSHQTLINDSLDASPAEVRRQTLALSRKFKILT